MVVAYLVRQGREGDSGNQGKLGLEQALRLAEVLFQYGPLELTPLIRETLRLLSRCNSSFSKLQQSILNPRLVEQARVQFGCHCEELLDILSDYLNLSSRGGQEAAARLIVLNSIRRWLKKLERRSAVPGLLRIYDVWLEDVQIAYCTFPHSTEILNELHQVTLVMEVFELSGICPDQTRVYRKTLEESCYSNPVDYESLRTLACEILAMYMDWLGKYILTEETEAYQRPLLLNTVITDVIDRYSHCLFPLFTSLIRSLSQRLGAPYYLPLVLGTATGKVHFSNSGLDLPTAYFSLILMTPHLPAHPSSLPSSVQALILTRDQAIDPRFITHCKARHLLLAISLDCVPAPTAVEVHVTSGGVTFM